ncbi:MAG: rhodanese-like domain-containing protein [Cryomorphaceae bacterium]|nr:rhodanese-like domain-containing protein [Cryomorphaceae bacterium]
MNEISVSQLKAMRDNNTPHQLIDVREQHEVDAATFGGEHIPMGDIMSNIDRIRTDVPVVIHCRSGARSAAVVNALQNNAGLTNLHNLTGGIMAWAREIDPSLDV